MEEVAETRLQDVNAAEDQRAQLAHILLRQLWDHLTQAAQEPVHPAANLVHEETSLVTKRSAVQKISCGQRLNTWRDRNSDSSI